MRFAAWKPCSVPASLAGHLLVSAEECGSPLGNKKALVAQIHRHYFLSAPRNAVRRLETASVCMQVLLFYIVSAEECGSPLGNSVFRADQVIAKIKVSAEECGSPLGNTFLSDGS